MSKKNSCVCVYFVFCLLLLLFFVLFFNHALFSRIFLEIFIESDRETSVCNVANKVQ